METEPEQRTDILNGMVRAAAPRACERYGVDPILNAVGKRPVIALLIAREIERSEAELRDGDDRGRRLAHLLIRMGWLESDGNAAHVAHDVVADEAVDRCLFAGAGGRRAPAGARQPKHEAAVLARIGVPVEAALDTAAG